MQTSWAREALLLAAGCSWCVAFTYSECSFFFNDIFFVVFVPLFFHRLGRPFNQPLHLLTLLPALSRLQSTTTTNNKQPKSRGLSPKTTSAATRKRTRGRRRRPRRAPASSAPVTPSPARRSSTSYASARTAASPSSAASPRRYDASSCCSELVSGSIAYSRLRLR